MDVDLVVAPVAAMSKESASVARAKIGAARRTRYVAKPRGVAGRTIAPGQVKRDASLKPMAMTEEDCLAMIRACREHGTKLMIAYRLHFDAANLTAIDLVQRGVLGDRAGALGDGEAAPDAECLARARALRARASSSIANA